MQLQQIEIPKIMLAGASAGITADILLHTMDTLKTRMQGQLTSNSIKYKRVFPSFKLILAQEGMQGLMAGFTPSVLGSLLATSFYFGCYETTKRNFGSTPLSFFASGVIAETLASVFYVPSEVCKTRLQLQGKFNNPHSLSPHNYRNTLHAITSIYSKRGVKGLYSG